jgi:hypothetical protein
MTLEEFKELQECYYASLDLIIHGRPKDTNGDSGDWWRRAVHITLKEFADLIQKHDPRQTLTETPANHFDRGAN